MADTFSVTILKYKNSNSNPTLQAELFGSELIPFIDDNHTDLSIYLDTFGGHSSYDLILRGTKIVTLDTGVILQCTTTLEQHFSSGGLCTAF